MKKKFVFLEDHIDVEKNYTYNKKSAIIKSGNPVLLKTDRFLEKSFMDIIGLNNQTRPYTLVVNTAGCQLNCWFCYAFSAVKKKDYDSCNPILLGPEELVQCFISKIKSLDKNNIRQVKLNHKTNKWPYRYFSKIRITGGEPLYSDSDVFKLNEEEISKEDSISYFLKFFELLDTEIKKLIDDNIIHLSPAVKYDEAISFPTFVAIKNNRIGIRFDTNGILFANQKFAEKFVAGIFNLFKLGKLNSLRIEIDYSFKGPTPIEFEWSQYNHLPIKKESLKKDFDVKDHPQYRGLKNIFDLIDYYNKEDYNFENCFGITVEKGIENKKNVFVNVKDGLNWELLEKKISEKLGIPFKFSQVKNDFDCSRGPGGFNYSRYRKKRNAAIDLSSNDETKITFKPTDPDSKEKEVEEIRSKLNGYDVIFYPVPEKEPQSELNKF